MKKDTKKHTLLWIITAFCILYIILALRPLSTELHLTPDWTEDISHVQEKRDGDTLIPFKLGQTMGFFTPDGRIVSSITFPFKAAVSDTWYATYGESNSETKVFHADGTQAGTIEEFGFPFFDKDRIYMFLPGGNAFAKYDENGEKLWSYESYAPITAFSSSESGCVVGLADGKLITFTHEGKVNQSFEPGGSSIPIILGAGISNDGSMVASISGQKQQRFVLAEKNGEHSRIIFHEYLPRDFTSQVLVKFSKNKNLVFYNYNGGLGIVNIDKLQSSHIEIPGIITQIEESAVDDLIFILSRDGDNYTVTAIEPFDHVAAHFSFKARKAFIQVSGDALFVGRNNKISRMTISRR